MNSESSWKAYFTTEYFYFLRTAKPIKDYDPPELIDYRPMMELMKGNYQYSLALFVRLTFSRARILASLTIGL